MNSRIGRWMILAVALAAVACGGSNAGSNQGTGEDDIRTGKPPEGAEDPEVGRVTGRTKSFAGTFTLDVEGKKAKLSFEMTGLDGDKPLFSSKVVDAGGTTGVRELDKHEVMIAVAMCGGCATYSVAGDKNEYGEFDYENPIAYLAFSEEGALSFEYDGGKVSDAKVTEVVDQ